MYRDGTLHNDEDGECTGTDNKALPRYLECSRTTHDMECTRKEQYCLHHYSEQLTRTFAVLVSLIITTDITNVPPPRATRGHTARPRD